ncbi:MAG: chemotaxis protein CheA [Acidobacteria bacterium]|nr:chemotaxis protein CheA [Acidobacteriota bacterium]
MTGPGDTKADGGEFVSEAEDLLEELGRELQGLEKERRQGRVRPQGINAAFRHVHSLKGLSGLFGHEHLGQLAHILEDFLDGLRMGRHPLDESALDVLFESHERMESMVASGDEAQAAPLDLINRLAVGEEKKAPPDGRRTSLPEDILRSLTRYEEHRLHASIRAGHELWLVSVTLSLETFDQDLRRLASELNECGEVISTLPCYEAGDAEARLSFRLLYACGFDARDIREFLPEDASLEAIAIHDPQDEVTSVSDEESLAGSGQEDDVFAEPLDRASVRVPLERLDRIMDVVGELLLFRHRMDGVSRELMEGEETRSLGHELHRASGELDKKLQDLQRSVIGARMVPVSRIVGRLARLVRKMARASGKDIMLETEGSGTELDKMMIDHLQSPLIHLVRNAIHHGIESPLERKQAGKAPIGRLLLKAVQRGNEVVLSLSDDGRGLDLEAVRQTAVARGMLEENAECDLEVARQLVFQPGFSSVKEVGNVSGRGVGLDVVKSELQNLGGEVHLFSEPGAGTTVEISLPITLAIMPCMVVRSGGLDFAIPVSGISETLRYLQERVETVAQRPVLRLRGETLPYADLRELLHMPMVNHDEPGFVVIARVGAGRLAMGVDELLGQHEVVIKPVGSLLDGLPGISGATEMGGGRAALVLDLPSLAAAPTSLSGSTALETEASP